VTGPCIAVLGERIVDFVPGVDPRSYRAVAGGSPANVALGIRRLGGEPVLLGRAGDDGLSALLDGAIVDNGLSTAALLRRTGPSVLAVCTRGADGSVSYYFYYQGSPDFLWNAADLDQALTVARQAGASAWHTGSLVSWLGPGVDEVLAAWRSARDAGDLTLSYDPNARPGTVPRDEMRVRVESFVALSDVVKVSDEDLLHLYPDESAEEVCQRWARMGPEVVVLTRGAHGLVAWRPSREVMDVPGRTVTVVDTVGAGDTVTAALLMGLGDLEALGVRGRIASVDDDALRRILQRAVVAAGITCSRQGAQPPTREEVDAAVGTPA
jgi:fructokinase